MLNRNHRWVMVFIGFVLQFWQTGLCAQQWEVLNEISGAHWHDIHFADEQNGWMIGWPGTVLHTANGGITWEEQFRFPEQFQKLWAVHFVDANHGWVVGLSEDSVNDGLVFSTNDGGKHWQKRDGPCGVIWGVHFVDEKEGWVVGFLVDKDDGSFKPGIVHTKDGGISWELQWQGKVGKGLSAAITVFFLNNQEGWVAGAGDAILFTQDGGVTWRQSKLNLRKGAIIYKILFLNQQTGWAVGQYSDGISLVLHTADGGKSWKVQYEGQSDKAAFDLYFLDLNEGWVVGNTYIDNTPLQRGFVLHTADGGESWERQDMDEMAQAIHFITPENGFLVGLHNALLETKDGGKNWISRFKRGYRLTDVTFRPGGKGWIVANSDQQTKFAAGMTQILQTTDAGQTWGLISELSSSASQGLYFHDSQHGISVGFKIDKTQDRGKTWTTQERPGDFLNAVDFATNEQGVAVGKQGRIYLTHDGGATWEQLKEVTVVDLYDVQFINDKEGLPSNEVKGWIVGGTFRKGVVLHTRDGGRSWNNLADLGDTVFALQMLDSHIGWAVGAGGNIWHTQNGGKNWQLQLTRYPTFYDVLFLDANKGWAVGAAGTIVSTKDGGRTWQKQNSPTDMDLIQIAYNQRDALIAVGDWNTILRYQDDSLLRYAKFSVDVKGKFLTKWGFVKSQLYQNFPNPFNPETWIPYQLAEAGDVKVFIYNSQGKLVRRLDFGRQLAGTYLSKEQVVYWNGRNENGELVSSGVYFYTLQVGDFRSTKRMVLLK